MLFFVEGRLVEDVDQGMTVFWKQTAGLTWRSIDLREQVLDVAGQEIMTADKVTLRMNLIVTYQVTDAVRAVTAVLDFAQALYREAQLALRGAVSVRALDALLTDKTAVGAEVIAGIGERAAELGVAIKSVGLRDVILPGDMKTILNQVIEAEKQAEANLIRRREETAAARTRAWEWAVPIMPAPMGSLMLNFSPRALSHNVSGQTGELFVSTELRKSS